MGAATSPSTESIGRNQAEEWSMVGWGASAEPGWVRRARPGQCRSGPGGAVRGRAWPRGGGRVEAMCEREAGERKGRLRYYTRLCSSDRHISRQT
jgi:hypothetical protein